MTKRTTPYRPSTPAGLLRRILALSYDGVIVFALLLLAGLVALPFSGAEMRAGRNPLFTLYLLAVWFAYFGWSWRRLGMTLGMRAWRIRLVTPDGVTPGWGRCLLRFTTALLSGAALGAGYLWSLFERQGRSWHDLASDTHLIVIPKVSGRTPQIQGRGNGKNN